jgi:hypothetical protein
VNADDGTGLLDVKLLPSIPRQELQELQLGALVSSFYHFNNGGIGLIGLVSMCLMMMQGGVYGKH